MSITFKKKKEIKKVKAPEYGGGGAPKGFSDMTGKKVRQGSRVGTVHTHYYDGRAVVDFPVGEETVPASELKVVG